MSLSGRSTCLIISVLLASHCLAANRIGLPAAGNPDIDAVSGDLSLRELISRVDCSEVQEYPFQTVDQPDPQCQQWQHSLDDHDPPADIASWLINTEYCVAGVIIEIEPPRHVMFTIIPRCARRITAKGIVKVNEIFFGKPAREIEVEFMEFGSPRDSTLSATLYPAVGDSIIFMPHACFGALFAHPQMVLYTSSPQYGYHDSSEEEVRESILHHADTISLSHQMAMADLVIEGELSHRVAWEATHAHSVFHVHRVVKGVAGERVIIGGDGCISNPEVNDLFPSEKSGSRHLMFLSACDDEHYNLLYGTSSYLEIDGGRIRSYLGMIKSDEYVDEMLIKLTQPGWPEPAPGGDMKRRPGCSSASPDLVTLFDRAKDVVHLSLECGDITCHDGPYQF